MNIFDYTVTTEKPFEEAVMAIEKKTGEKGFRVLHGSYSGRKGLST